MPRLAKRAKSNPHQLFRLHKRPIRLTLDIHSSVGGVTSFVLFPGWLLLRGLFENSDTSRPAPRWLLLRISVLCVLAFLRPLGALLLSKGFPCSHFYVMV